LHWPVGLARRPLKAKAFYGTIAAATLVGGALNFTPIDPVKALFWSAVINGVVAVPVMAMTMRMATSRKIMGKFRVRGLLRALGWLATVTMALAAIGMFATWGPDRAPAYPSLASMPGGTRSTWSAVSAISRIARGSVGALFTARARSMVSRRAPMRRTRSTSSIAPSR